MKQTGWVGHSGRLGWAWPLALSSLLCCLTCMCVSGCGCAHAVSSSPISCEFPLPSCCASLLLGRSGLSSTLQTQVALHSERPRVSAFLPEEFIHEAASREIIRTRGTKLQETSSAE